MFVAFSAAPLRVRLHKQSPPTRAITRSQAFNSFPGSAWERDLRGSASLILMPFYYSPHYEFKNYEMVTQESI